MIKVIIMGKLLFADKSSLLQQFTEIYYTFKTICLWEWHPWFLNNLNIFQNLLNNLNVNASFLNCIFLMP